MNKILIAAVATLLVFCQNVNAQEGNAQLDFNLEFDKWKVKAHEAAKEAPTKRDRGQTKSNFAHFFFISDMDGSIWIDNKEHKLEVDKPSQKIAVAELFTYYFVTSDKQFETEDKTKKIRPHNKGITDTLHLLPKTKFRAFIRQEKEKRASQQIFQNITNQLIEIGSGVSMSSHEVTLEQYAQFIKETGASIDKNTDDASRVIKYIVSVKGIRAMEEDVDWRCDPYGKRINLDNKELLDYPVINVSWYEAKAFCEWLSGKDPLYKYRLPSAKEWESVAKLLPNVPLSEQANFADISLQELLINKKVTKGVNDNFPLTNPVGALKSNAKGFYDMHGNVAEWMEDDLDEFQKNRKIIKGGSYFIIAQPGLIQDRKKGFLAGARHSAIGFRICREQKDGL